MATRTGACAVVRWVGVALLALSCACAHRRDARAPRPAAASLVRPGDPCRGAETDSATFCLPVARVERALAPGDLEILSARRTQHGLAGAYKLLVRPRTEDREDALTFHAKWKPAPPRWERNNNNPRKEIAVYEVQKLFLAPDEYVVPPTFGACVSATDHAAHVRPMRSRFSGVDCVFGVASYWLDNVTEDRVYDRRRFADDREYARHIANLNLLTYIVDHRDTRHSNLLVSTDASHPRAFAVDNGNAFGGVKNILARRDWSRIIVPALPAATMARLRELDRTDLARLATVAQYQVRDRRLVPTPPTEPLSTRHGTRFDGKTLQLGLTRGEIRRMARRIDRLLDRVADDKLELF